MVASKREPPEFSLSLKNLRWVMAMAWRDSRGHRRKLILFCLCIISGIGALVAIQSFRHNLKTAIDEQARTLLGADLAFRSRKAFSEKAETFIASVGGEQVRETRFRTMAYFPDRRTTRLVQVRALSGPFPFYGTMDTEPGGVDFHSPDRPLAVVENSLLLQFGIKPGGKMKLGALEFTVAGGLLRVSGENEIRGIFSPRVYIDERYLTRTGLIQRGSLTRYRVYFKFPRGVEKDLQGRLEKAKSGLFAKERIRLDTVERRKRNVGRIMSNLYDFLNLIGFIALLLGGLGVGGAVQVYMKEKLDSVALLRCLGTPLPAAFGIYLFQILLGGLLGSLAGVFLGLSIQYLLPSILRSLLPFAVEVFISWSSVLSSFIFGWGLTFLFALIPLLPLRSITPLRALRISIENPHLLRKDPWFWAISGLIAAIVLGFCFSQTRKPAFGLGFAAILAASLLLLCGLAVSLRWGLKKCLPKSWPYVLRQGLANLYRPNNRTLFLIVTLGMGTFLVLTIYHAQSMLLQQAEFRKNPDKPNMVIFDIQRDQEEGVKALVRKAGYPVREAVPIVTMRIAQINGRSVAAIKNDPAAKAESWALNWEYRSTYRERLIETEKILRGHLVPKTEGGRPVPISVEESIAEDLHVEVGDRLVFDVQGVLVATRIASIRKVDWAQLRPNFYILFPLGVLEEAPHFFALTTRLPDRAGMASLQQSLVESYPNVSAIDLSLVLDTITAILERISFVIRFMASFTVATGFFVLTGAILTSRYQRLQESVLLCTLGATGGLIRRIMSVEYLILGFLSGTAGVFLSLLAALGLSHFVFEIPYRVSWSVLFLIILLVGVLTLLTGLINSRGIANHPPLAVLREEG